MRVFFMSKLRKFLASRSNIFLIFNLSFIIIIFILGFWPETLRPKIGKNDLAYYNNQTLELSGRICEEADLDYKSRRLTVCVSGQIEGQVLVTTNLYPVYDYGDFIKIKGRLQAPPIIEGFDYESYLARYHIYSVMYYPKISLLDNSKLTLSQEIYKNLIKFKQQLVKIINRNLPEPESGLANAILFGYRRTVLREDLDIFARVGLSHMIAISGSHITILSAMVINFFLFLGIARRRALTLVFLFLFLYPLITGLSASAVRSAIMGALAFLAIYYQRVSSLIKALVLSASLMLVFNSQLLASDIGFQLSFLALLGIIYLYPLGEAKSRRFLEKRSWSHGVKNFWKIILDTVNLTLVSQIVILPIALVNFGQLSIIAPLANILVLWTFPPLLAALIIALFLSALLPGLGILFFAPAYFLLKFIFIISSWLALPSWAAVNIAGFNWGQGVIYYFFLIIIIWRARKKTE